MAYGKILTGLLDHFLDIFFKNFFGPTFGPFVSDHFVGGGGWKTISTVSTQK